MRMSSGASVAYEKPRSGRSICILETPRSSRIASARAPSWASWRSTIENSPRRSRVWTPAWRRKLSKYGRTDGSRSTAIRRPCPCSSPASSAAWPPAPNVASTTVSPGCTSSSSRTSSPRTGTWSVVSGCKAFGNMLRAPFDGLQLLAPRGAVPDLEVVVDAGDDDLAREARGADQGRRQHHPALLVEVDLRGRREEVALDDAVV